MAYLNQLEYCATIEYLDIPKIQLMHGLVIDIAAKTLGYLVSVACRFSHLSEMFLLIANEMFGAGNYSRALNSLDRLGNQDTGKDWIWALRSSAFAFDV